MNFIIQSQNKASEIIGDNNNFSIKCSFSERFFMSKYWEDCDRDRKSATAVRSVKKPISKNK